MAELRSWKDEIEVFSRKVVGFTGVLLTPSRERESTMGNFAADTMVWAYRNRTGKHGGKILLALMNSGGTRAGIEVGNITMGDLLSVYSHLQTKRVFDNSLCLPSY